MASDSSSPSAAATSDETRPIYVPIAYGSMAFPLSKEEKGEGDSTHRWRVYFRAADNRDLAYVVRSVSFTLHPSFADPVRDISTAPFEVAELGWGEFEVVIKVFFADDSLKPVTFKHTLKLYPPPGQTLPEGFPVVVENYDEIVLNEPHKLSPEAKASLLAGPTGSTQLTADDAYYLEHSPDADLSVLAGAHVFVRSETERLRERLARAESDAAQLVKDVAALGGAPHADAPTHLQAEAAHKALQAAHAGQLG